MAYYGPAVLVDYSSWSRDRGQRTHDPAVASLVFDPEFVKSACQKSEEKREAQSTLYQFCVDRINGLRKDHLIYLRTESLRPLAQTNMLSAQALLLGKPQFFVVPTDHPHHEAAIEVFTTLYYKNLHELVEIAVQDFLISGLGGIVYSPFGIGLIRPETSVAFPNWVNPRWMARFLIADAEQLYSLWRKSVIKDYIEQHRNPQQDAVPKLDKELGIGAIPIPILEVFTKREILYFFEGELLKRQPLEPQYQMLPLVGDERTVWYSRANWVDLLSDEGVTEERFDWVSERDPDYIDLPVGVMEKLAAGKYHGVSILEAHEKMIEEFLLLTLRSNVSLMRPDAIDMDEQSSEWFIQTFNPLFLLRSDDKTPPVQFVHAVSPQEMAAGIRELEQLSTMVTGITAYMMGTVGNTDVASEVVAAQQQANIRLSYIHQRVQDWLDRVVSGFRQFLVSLAPPYQEPIAVRIKIEGFEPPQSERIAPPTLFPSVVSPSEERMSGYQTLIVGGRGRASLAVSQVGYETFFSPFQIKIAAVGEFASLKKRQDLMQLLQILVQLIPIAAQLGVMYNIEPLIDAIIAEFGLDAHKLKMKQQQQPQAVVPAAMGEPQALPPLPPERLAQLNPNL